jgi:hypothetical protein
MYRGKKAQFVGFEVITVATMKNAVFWHVAPCDLIYTDVSEERIESIFKVEEITLARKSVRQETSVNIKPTRRHTPEYGTLQKHSSFLLEKNFNRLMITILVEKYSVM